MGASLHTADGYSMWNYLQLKPLTENVDVALNLSSSSLRFKSSLEHKLIPVSVVTNQYLFMD